MTTPDRRHDTPPNDPPPNDPPLNDPPGSEPVGHHRLDKRGERRVLIAMCTALVAVVASMSGLNVAQQDLALDLGASQSQVLWIINSYTLTLAALLMPIGAVGDRWGRKPVLLVGLALFGVASLGAAMVDTPALMIVARVIAGAGAAMIMPVTLSVITSTFPPEDRGRAIGIWAGFAGSGGLIGLFVSAFMVDVLTWRWLFALPITLVLVAAVATVRHVPNSAEGAHSRFDLAGSVLSALAIGGLVLAIHEGPEVGWTATITLVAALVGVVALGAFIAHERRVPNPLLDMSAFRNRGLASGSLTLLALFAVMSGTLLVLFPYFQAVLGWSALRSAVAIMPMAVAMMPMSTIAPQIAARIGSRTTMTVGLSIFVISLVTLATSASVDGGYLSVLPGLVLLGVGLGLTMTPSTEAITETLPLEKQGVASALNDTSREIGAAIGVALLGSVLSAGYRSSIEPALAGLPDEMVETASEGIGSAFGVAAQAGPEGARIIEAARYALVDGWITSMWVGAALGVISLVYVVVRGPLPRHRAARPDDALVDTSV